MEKVKKFVLGALRTSFTALFKIDVFDVCQQEISAQDKVGHENSESLVSLSRDIFSDTDTTDQQAPQRPEVYANLDDGVHRLGLKSPQEQLLSAMKAGKTSEFPQVPDMTLQQLHRLQQAKEVLQAHCQLIDNALGNNALNASEKNYFIKD